MANANVTRTAIAGVFQTATYIGKPVPSLPNSTLNQKLGIAASETLAQGEVPSVKYLVIGRGGHGFTMGSGGKIKYLKRPHTPRHTALYDQIPFILRPVNNDLTPNERLKYRYRKRETHNGQDYYAYYARVLDLSAVKIQMELRHVEDGVTTSQPYLPTLEDLNPTPPALIAGEAVTTTGDYAASSAKIPFVMTGPEVQDFVNACRIIDNEEGFAVISEMATVSGIDRAVTGEFTGVQQQYTEVIYGQITAFIVTAWIMEYQTDGIVMTIDVGNVEPLLTTNIP